MIASIATLLFAASAAYAQSTAAPESSVTAANITMMFTNPVSNTTWGYSQNETIQWTAPGVDDPKNVSLLLANVYNASVLCVIVF